MKVSSNRSGLRVQLGRDCKQGGALAMVLIFVTAIAVMSAGFIQLSSAVANRRNLSIDNKRAFYLAEAGLAEAWWGLRTGKTGQVGSQESPAAFGDGLLWVDSELDEATGRVSLESTGMCASGRATLSLVAEQTGLGFGSLGMFSQRGIKLQHGTFLDSYDSTQGTYEEQVAAGINREEARLGSNGDILLEGGGEGITLLGHASPGVAMTLTLEGQVQVTGSTANLEEPVELPPVEVPQVTVLPPVKHGTALPFVVPPGEIGYESITLGRSSEMIVQGPAILVLGSLATEGDSSIHFDTAGGPIDVYVTGSIVLSNKTAITASDNDPAMLTLLIAAAAEGEQQEIKLDADCRFFGTIYAPEGQVLIGKGFELFGAASAGQLICDPKTLLHFDLNLLNPSAGGSNAGYQFLSWRVIDIPSKPRMSRLDPFHVLGVERGSLRKPAESHTNVWIKIRYLNGSGVVVNYEGWEKSFKPGKVQSVIGRKTYTNNPSLGGTILVNEWGGGKMGNGSQGKGQGQPMSGGGKVRARGNCKPSK